MAFLKPQRQLNTARWAQRDHTLINPQQILEMSHLDSPSPAHPGIPCLESLEHPVWLFIIPFSLMYNSRTSLSLSHSPSFIKFTEVWDTVSPGCYIFFLRVHFFTGGLHLGDICSLINGPHHCNKGCRVGICLFLYSLA